jgi:hypothetical protein
MAHAGWWLLAVATLLLSQQCNAQGAFLQQQLPLKITVTTPSALSDSSVNNPLALTGRQAITVSFLIMDAAAVTLLQSSCTGAV